MVTAVVFDMDGVIFDTERLCIKAWKHVAEREGLDGIEQVCYKCIGVNSRETERIVRESYGDKIDYERLRRDVDKAVSDMLEKDGMPIKAGAEEILIALKERAVPTALASSTKSERVKSELSSAGLLKYFDVIIGGEMVSKSKPEPDIFLAACKALGVESVSCAAVEDSFNGIKAAKSAKMFTIMVPDILQPNEELLPLIDKKCRDLFEAKELLLRLLDKSYCKNRN